MISIIEKTLQTKQQYKSTQDHLKDIYVNMKSQLKETHNNIIEIQEAKTLQEFLQQLKDIQNLMSAGMNANDAIASAIVDMQRQSLFNDLLIIKPEIFNTKFLISKGEKTTDTGLKLEIGISRIIKGMGAYALAKQTNNSIESGKTYNTFIELLESKGMSGTTNIGHATVNLVEVGNEKIREKFIETYNDVREVIFNHFNTDINKSFKYINTFPAVQGKIDVNGLNASLNLKLSTNIDGGITAALQNSTFTLKNYASNLDIHLGKTNPFRVYVSVGADYYHYPWPRLMNCLHHHYSNIHPFSDIFFYRIRAIYELTGYGQNYTNSALNTLLGNQGAKFLIFNQAYAGGSIKVVPTSSLTLDRKWIESLTPKNVEDALFGPITISQSELLQY